MHSIVVVHADLNGWVS